MNIKLLITCPTCSERGLKMNLAQVLPDGRIAVRRFDENSTTVIGGQNMYIQCGLCNAVVFKRIGATTGTMWGTVVRYHYEGNLGVGSSGEEQQLVGGLGRISGSAPLG